MYLTIISAMTENDNKLYYH